MNHLDSQKSTTLKAVIALFGLNAAIWIILGVVSLTRQGGIGDTAVATRVIIAVLMFANAAGMLWMGYSIARRSKVFFYLALGFLGVNILLTITDEFGTLDLITLLIDLVLVGLILLNRSNFINYVQN